MSNDNENQRDDRSKRRAVVKGITIAGTGVTLTHWSKPVVETIILPTHAQTSVALTASAQFVVTT